MQLAHFTSRAVALPVTGPERRWWVPVAVVDGLSGVAPLAGLLLVGKLATCGVLDDPQAVSPIAAITMIAASPPHRPYGLGVLARLSAAVVFIALSLGWCATRL